jgi:hypothetical protein
VFVTIRADAAKAAMSTRGVGWGLYRIEAEVATFRRAGYLGAVGFVANNPVVIVQ